MQTDRATRTLLGIIIFLSLGSLQAGMALQEGNSVCSVSSLSTSSLEICRVQAEAGDVLAQAILGFAYDYGQGVPQDNAEALRWYRLAAEQGNAGAQRNLGLKYDTSRGVPEDDGEAVRWFRLAAERGNTFAQGNLGVIYATGEGVVQNDARAYLWFNLAAAASQGDDRARRVEARDRVAANLSPADRAAAQRLATQCQASGFKDCGEPE